MTTADFKRQQLFKQRITPMTKEYTLFGILILWLVSAVMSGLKP